MKSILMVIVASVCSFISIIPANAARQYETEVKGKVIEYSNGAPAGWATVALMAEDSTIVAGATCDEEGRYRLKATPGKYLLSASLIGCKDKTQSITLSGTEMSLDPIYLEQDSQMLNSATVTGMVSLVEMKLDKVVMNVSQSAFASGSNALELIKKAPGVTIDKDGNVKLNGKPVSIWVDGRPSYLDGKALENLLKSTNGDSIDKFELMEHPSSKYDAAGQGGIINIKTKRNFAQGFNGSAGLGGGAMYFKKWGATNWNQSMWANLSLRTKKSNTFLNLYESFDNTPVTLNKELTIASSDFYQKSNNILVDFGHHYNVKLGNDWFIDDKNTFGVILLFPGTYETTNAKRSNTEQYSGGSKICDTGSKITNGPNRASRFSTNLNYTHIFDPERSSEITANLDYYRNGSKSSNSQTDTLAYVTAPHLPYINNKTMDSDQIYDIYSAKADYQSILWKKFMFESGAKWAFSRTDNNSIETKTGEPDVNSNFIYKENIGALYFSLAGQFNPKWSFKAGLRGEYTGSYGDWKSAGTHTDRKYFDLFPTVYFGYTPSEKWRFSFSYTRRIGRPSYGQLDPTKMFLDATTYIVGNPDIKPQYNDDLSLSAGMGQHFSLQLTYDYGYNLINQIPSYDPDGTQCMTWGNMGKNHIGVVSFNVSALPIGKWLQWTLSTGGYYINSSVYGSSTDYSSLSGYGYTDFTFLLPKDWKIDLDGRFNTPMRFGYYKIHTSWQSDLAVKKTLLDNRLVLTFKLDDIFRSANNDVDIIEESGTITSFRQNFCIQQIALDITWNFGKAQKPMRQRRVGNLEEVSRVGGSSSGIGGK